MGIANVEMHDDFHAKAPFKSVSSIAMERNVTAGNPGRQ